MRVADFTKYIVEGLLGEESKKKVATFAGSFRPPTKSDYNLLLKAIDDNPGLDEIHVFVGDSESEGLNQDDAVSIWKMFGEHFPRNFYVHKSEQSPVSDVYAYANKYPTYDIDWLFGVREGNSDDFKQVADRTKSVNKYDNLSISPVVYDNKATEREVGAAANMGKDELAKYMPNNLTYKELDDVYNMLQPKELQEVVYPYSDNIINKIVEEGWEYFDTMGDLPSKAAKVQNKARGDKKKYFTLALERDLTSNPPESFINIFWSDKGNGTQRDVIAGGTIHDYEDIKDAGQISLKEVTEEDLATFDEVIRKIVDEGFRQYQRGQKLTGFHRKTLINDMKETAEENGVPGYFALAVLPSVFSEGEAQVHFSTGETFFLGDLSPDDIKDIEDAADFSLNEVEDGDLANFESVLNKIVDTKAKHYSFTENPSRLHGSVVVDRLKDLEKETGQPQFAIQVFTGGIVVIFSDGSRTPLDNADQQDIDDLLGASEFNLSESKQAGTEFDIYEQIIDFMSQNGMKLDPRPTINVIDNDRENAEQFFGKTAYYDPSNNIVVLYTLGRHPKDVARSFAHELVHCHQNNEGRLEGITTTNTNEDDHLEEIEREAYETGNIMFRKWSDSVKGGALQETVKDNKIICDNCGWEWDIDDGGDDIFTCHKCGHEGNESKVTGNKLNETKFKNIDSNKLLFLEALQELKLSVSNALPIKGNDFKGTFETDNKRYQYEIYKIDVNEYKDLYNVIFEEEGGSNALPTGNAKDSYIKILSTMYKVISNFTEKHKPQYLGLASLDTSGYYPIYLKLSKTNSLPNYSKKEIINVGSGNDKIKVIVFKRKGELNETVKDNKIICDNCGWKWDIDAGGDDMFTCHKCGNEDNQPVVTEKKEIGKDEFAHELSMLREDKEL